MEKKLIELHEEWKKDGWLPKEGLCSSVPGKYKKTLQLFNPNDYKEYANFWGADIPYSLYRESRNQSRIVRWQHYGELRQSIVLLICAMHGEL